MKVSILPRGIDVAVNEAKFEFELRVLNGKRCHRGARMLLRMAIESIIDQKFRSDKNLLPREPRVG